MTARALAGLALSLWLTGCMVGPDYRRPAASLPPAYPGATADATPASAIQHGWWTLFNDPLLNELVGAALANNSDVRRAVARIEETDANLRAVDAAFLPEVDFGATANRSAYSGTVALTPPSSVPSVRNDLRFALSSSFEIDFWGKLRRSVEVARAQTLASRYARDVVMLSLAGLTTQTYFALRSLDAQISTTRTTLATRDDGLNLVRRRADAGYASDLDLRQAEGARSDAAAQLSELTRQRAIALHQLGTLTGRLDLAVAPGDLAQLPLPALPPAGLPSALLERRPDLRQAEQDLIAANARVGIAMAVRLPSISLTGNYGGESRALGLLLDGPSRIWSIGAGLTVPVFDAGKLAALADAERARYKQTVATYEQTTQTAFREVADALTNVRQIAATETELQASVTSAREALRLATRRYDAGYSSFLEVLDAQRTANLSQLALIRNRQALLSSDVDLMKALGGGWDAAETTAAK
ncbi:MAG: efflux transporter outer membrane subunit [Aromatoleum sp.]|nr:efflux transporter outer membrane subunit [Aromatoleum sp.]